MEKKLEVKNLRISFRTDAGKVQAVRGIDFDLYKGETLAIVGESGSGKSVTNKAIIGISAPNAIVESGEIIYDGMDLLQINEEEFHKLRGDKIAMIFQDPLSALDPINRIGMQLTEAMILKNRANRRESRKAFNTRMKLLCAAMNDAMGVDEKSPRGVENAKLCKDFDTFECLHLKLEGAYNVAYENAENGLESADDLLFHIEKNAVSEFARSVREIVANAEKSVNEYVSDSDIVEFAKAFRIEADNVRKTRGKVKDYSKVVAPLTALRDKFKEAVDKKMPNFFAFAYYKTFGHNEMLPDGDIDELNAFLRKYLDDNFMLSFIEDVKKGVVYSFEKSTE